MIENNVTIVSCDAFFDFSGMKISPEKWVVPSIMSSADLLWIFKNVDRRFSVWSKVLMLHQYSRAQRRVSNTMTRFVSRNNFIKFLQGFYSYCFKPVLIQQNKNLDIRWMGKLSMNLSCLNSGVECRRNSHVSEAKRDCRFHAGNAPFQILFNIHAIDCARQLNVGH